MLNRLLHWLFPKPSITAGPPVKCVVCGIVCGTSKLPVRYDVDPPGQCTACAARMDDDRPT